VHSGLAVFYDAGDVTDRLRDVFLRQSAGIGLRFVAPQFDRVVLRADWAFPFNPPHGTRTLPGALFIGYGQAFSPPVLSSPSVMTPDAR
jgi:outer membrane protein assembly factor BamA